jgi:low affinity Fe/Cu permease
MQQNETRKRAVITVTGRDERILRILATVLVVIWFMGLLTGYTVDSFIHILVALAIILLVICVSLEVNIYRGLKGNLYDHR